jgi:ankyrin repeat protein
VLQHCFGSNIRQTLDQLPETLDDTYARMLSQIPPVNRANAHRMLQCLMVAVRPLRVEELAELFAFEFGRNGTGRAAVPKYRADWRPNDQVHAVQTTCSSLISIVDDSGSQVVQFSHFSVKEFLMSDRLTSSLGDFSQYQILPRPAHTILAQACLGYLLHFDGHVDEGIAKGFPLAEYAAEHWVTHAQFEDVASRVKDGMETLFDCDKRHFAAWVGIYDMDREFSPESSSKIPTPLYYSSLCGFSDLVEHLSTKHPQHVNAIGGMYKFPLLAALAGNHIRVAETLLKHGANVDIRGLAEQTPLHEAIESCVGMVQSLLNKGADVNCRNDDLHTPLHLAVYYGELKVARVLVEHKADVNSQNKEGKTPMHVLLGNSSCDNDDILDLARLLLEHGADVNARQKYGCTSLHYAAFKGRVEVAQFLLDHGAKANMETENGETALHIVSRGEYGSEEHGISIARLFLGRGLDVNAREKDGRTSLHWAAFKGRVEVAQFLLDHGANANMASDTGETALNMVSEGEYDSQEQGVSTARLLLERGVDVNARRKDSWTSLHWAAFKGRVEVARVLLDHGANATLETANGETALHIVSRGEYDSEEHGIGIARLLLGRGLDVNAREKNGRTSLHYAAFKGRVEVAQFLLDHGANATLETDEGESALHMVSRGEYDSQEQGVSTARLLLERGADVNARRKDSWTSLHWAAFKGRVEVARFLLDHGSTMVRTRTWRPTWAKRRCTSCHEATTPPKNKVSALHGYYWSAAWM